jgi:hypothetical protein
MEIPMSMKPIVVAASMLATVFTLTAAQAAPTTAGSQAAGPRQGTTHPLALLILGPQQNAVG